MSECIGVAMGQSMDIPPTLHAPCHPHQHPKAYPPPSAIPMDVGDLHPFRQPSYSPSNPHPHTLLCICNPSATPPSGGAFDEQGHGSSKCPGLREGKAAKGQGIQHRLQSCGSMRRGSVTEPIQSASKGLHPSSCPTAMGRADHIDVPGCARVRTVHSYGMTALRTSAVI